MPRLAYIQLWLTILLSGLLTIFAAAPAVAEDIPEVRVGVLAFRSIETTQQEWQPTIDYLNDKIPRYHFVLKALYFPQMDEAVREKRLEFVFTNPRHYIILEAEYNVDAIATLIRLQGGHPVNKFGSVIFTRADRADINVIRDLRGKVLATVSEQSFGGYLAPRWTLLRNGMSMRQFSRIDYTNMPHDNVVKEVLSGRADVGFVRTGVLESMVKEQSIRLDQVKVLNQQPKSVFPQLLSTDLYPEWPVAVMPHVEPSLRDEVAQTLQRIDPEDYAARMAGYYGFSEPGDYATAEAVILRLQMEPSAQNVFDWRDIYREYPKATLGTLVVTLLIMFASALYFWRTNRKMRRSQFERDKLALHLQIANTTLEEKIAQRTQEIHQLQGNLQRMLDSMAEGMYGVDTAGHCTFVNAAFLKLLGYSQPEEVIGKHIHELIHHSHSDGTPYPSHECHMYQAFLDRREINVDNEVFWRKDRSPLAVEYWSHPIIEQGEVIGAVATFLDITERKKAEAVLLRNQVVIDTAQDGFWMTDAQGALLEVNQAYERISGYSRAELLQMHIAQLEAHESTREQVDAHIAKIVAAGSDQFETRHRRKDGAEIDVEVSVTFEPTLRLFFVFCRDISERKKAEQEIHQLAFYDTLTCLPNRRLLLDRMQMALAMSERNDRYGALMFLDLDRFKVLNDTKGHDVGDLLLIEVAQRLKLCTRDIDIVSRLGGDEFVVVLEMLDGSVRDAAAQAESIAEKIRDELGLPYQLKNHLHHTTPSIGVVLFKGYQASVEDLLKHADTAMYQAKNAGRNTIRFYDPALQAEMQARIALEQALHIALAQQQFRLLYQVQVNADGQAMGSECLLRWEHPQRGLLAPVEFMALLEESGLIVPVGLWVFKTACQQLSQWQSLPSMAQMTLAVNVSARQFRQPDFVAQIRQVLAESGATPHLLKLELTESTVLENVEETIAKMYELRRLGLGLAMDDFGTGYSSLHYLKRLPLDQVKIDRAFVRDIALDPNDAVIVEAIIAMSNALGLSVIAEGVEDISQLSFLTEHGCRAFQGYLFGEPLAAEQLVPHIHQLTTFRPATDSV